MTEMGALCPCHVQADIEQVWDRLIAMVHDPEAKVRSSVLHALCDGSPRVRESEIVRAIESMYHDPDPKLRRHVRHVLASYRRTGKINIL
ncbi:MAG TPA: HEAT repeat domain-containing protein [Herpetosiphonaceae bacterium]|nr:HEAT repeat domain-containing protein [Herpetosiphonaceae bacterium]